MKKHRVKIFAGAHADGVTHPSPPSARTSLLQVTVSVMPWSPGSSRHASSASCGLRSRNKDSAPARGGNTKRPLFSYFNGAKMRAAATLIAYTEHCPRACRCARTAVGFSGTQS
jgi:hypothetical protein